MLDNPDFQGVKDDLEGMDEKGLRDQIERAHMIEQLSQHHGWPMFIDYLTALTTGLQERILTGRCGDIEEYRFLTGQVDGLLKAINAPKTLFERVRFQQELARQVEEDLSDEPE